MSCNFNTAFDLSSFQFFTKFETVFSDTSSGATADYNGNYSVTPNFEKQTLKTKNKTLAEDVTVLEIPIYKVGNKNGQTLTIGKVEN